MGRVLQIVGYQDSGKTTFIVEYINALTNQGLKVGTIKHHGHQEVIKHDDLHKDTGKHRQAGAQVSLVEGNGSVLLNSEKTPLTLLQLLTMYKPFQLDVIVIEGFKSESYPKVALIRSIEGIQMLKSLTNVVCILTSIEVPIEIATKYITFKYTNDCIDWLLTNKVGEFIE